MRNRFTQVLLAVGAALVIGGAPAAFAQPANCGDINNDGNIDAADSAALAAGTISTQCSNAMCADVNASGGVELGDQVVLSRFLAGGGTKAEPGRSRGEQNLLYKLCTGEGTPVACAGPGSPLTGTFALTLVSLTQFGSNYEISDVRFEVFAPPPADPGGRRCASLPRRRGRGSAPRSSRARSRCSSPLRR